MTLRDDLYRDPIDATTRAQLATLLRAGPWCWPEPVREPDARAAAERVAPGGPPAPACGETLLVGVGDRCGSVWRFLTIDDDDPRPSGCVHLDDDAARAWRDAIEAIPRSLPVLWRSVRTVALREPLARHLDRLVEPCGRAAPERTVDGRSYGLSFVLAIASLLFERPLPGDIAATGAVAPTGRVGAVDGLPRKLRTLAACAPGVRRFLVPEDCRDDELETLGASLGVTVIGVSSAGAAIAAAFAGDADGDLADLLVPSTSDEETRREFRAALFRLALEGKGASAVWAPVARAAALARRRWDDQLDGPLRWELSFCQAVAERHDANRGALALPPEGYLETLSAPLRLLVIANLVQHALDVGRPTPAEVTPLVDRHRVALKDAHGEHLRLLGAHARLLAVSGRPDEALRRQREIAAAFVDRFLFEELSYQLSEWYRLAAALGDAEAFAAADALCLLAERNGGLGVDGSPYVDCARACAGARLAAAAGQPAPREHVTALVRFAEREALRPLLGGTAHRVLRLLARRASGPEDALPDAAARVAARAPEDAAMAALVALDEALERGDGASAAAALDGLAAAQPAIVAHLSAAAPDAASRPAYVARFFPY